MSPRLFDLDLSAVLDRSEALTNAEDVFSRISEMPEDAVTVLDGNDAWHAAFTPGFELPDDWHPAAEADEFTSVNLRTLTANAATAPRALYVPLKRVLRPGMRGKDVLAVQRAMAKAGFRKWGRGFTGIYGPGLKEDVKQLQRRHGVKVTGIYDGPTHAYGKRYFDRYGAFLMASVKVPAASTGTPRQKIVAAAMFGYHNRGLIHYTQGPMRMYGVRNKIRIPRVPYYEDCSSFTTWCYWHAGLPDPNGLRYNGYGFTGTLANHGHRVSSPSPGDIALYGRYPHSHVTIYIGNGRCISHGSEIGPLLTSVHYRPVNHFRSYLRGV